MLKSNHTVIRGAVIEGEFEFLSFSILVVDGVEAPFWIMTFFYFKVCDWMGVKSPLSSGKSGGAPLDLKILIILREFAPNLIKARIFRHAI